MTNPQSAICNPQSTEPSRESLITRIIEASRPMCSEARFREWLVSLPTHRLQNWAEGLEAE